MPELWTASHHCADLYRAGGGQKPIYVIPHGIDPYVWRRDRTRPAWIPLDKDKKTEGPRGADKFVFLGAGTWHNPRKGLDLLIKAFTKEFKPEEPVELVLKVSNVYNPGFNAKEMIKQYIDPKGNKNIRIVDTVMDLPEMVRFFSNADCFVSPHRAEGFGLIILEAMAAGVPVIATGWSGNVDFTRNRTIELVKMRPYAPMDNLYGSEKVWMEISVKELKKRMREVYEGNYPYDTEAIMEEVRTKWTWEHATDMVVERMNHLYEEWTPKYKEALEKIKDTPEWRDRKIPEHLFL